MEVHSFSLQFRKQFQNRKSGIQTRELLIAEISDGGRTGLGEIAPLPGFSEESLAQARDQFLALSREIRIKALMPQEPADILETILDLDLYPSVECGIASALLDLRANVMQMPVHRLLTGRSVKSIACNGLIGLENRSSASDAAREAAQSGFQSIKLKFGRPEFENDIEILRAAVKAAGPDISFRLDVNGGWQYEQARQHLETLSEYPIDYIEQPLPADQLDELNQLQNESSIPIALDESISHVDAWDAFFEQSSLRILVIKPTVHGLFFLSPTFQTLAETHKVRLVVSSSFESPVGHAFLCQLAAAAAPDESHGLATLDLFEDSRGIGDGYPLTGGRIKLPEGPGLGTGIRLS
jgi:o-succinylbenzoate synthase